VILGALALVLAAAAIHATWNLLVKRVDAGLAFVWAFVTTSAVALTPAALTIVLFVRPEMGPRQLVFMGASALLQTAYFLTLQAGYRAADLSVVYPVARGTGAMLAAGAGIVLLGEAANVLSVGGILLAAAGVLVLAGGHARGHAARRGVVSGLAVGLLIASYTLVDAHTVGALAVPPLLLAWWQSAGSALALAPWALRRRDEVRAVWRAHRVEVLGVGLLSSIAYVLVLSALSFAPVSYVAPARELSVLIGVVLGTRLLGEVDAPRRVASAAAIAAGVLVLTLGLAGPRLG
jgi:drug/metabolite transporter (DMT)-like permease